MAFDLSETLKARENKNGYIRISVSNSSVTKIIFLSQCCYTMLNSLAKN